MKDKRWKLKIGITIALILFLLTPAFAEISLKAEVDKTSITTDEFVTYKITVNSDEQNTPVPEIPKFSGFNIVSQLQSSSLSLGSGRLNASIIYTYILAPMQVGKFKIEPCNIKIKGQTYTSDAIEIEVTQGKAKPQPKPKEEPRHPALPQPESEEPQVTL